MKKYFSILLLTASWLFHSCTKDGASADSSANSTGGSMARFTLVGNYLYTINQESLKTFNVTNPANPVLESTVYVGPDIETIFPFKGSLFIGSNTAAYRYSLSDPARPVKGPQANYIVRGRDPIVANDTVAYSTVRNINNTGGTLNIINVRNPESLLVMNGLFLSTSPYGLGMADSALYICEHSAGLKVYSIKEGLAYNPTVRKIFSNTETYYDVIPSGNLLYTWIEGGNSIFDISNRMNPVLLSKTKN